MKVASA
jgi:chromosome segregation ATPase